MDWLAGLSAYAEMETFQEQDLASVMNYYKLSITPVEVVWLQ